jgi:hypothetical protein
MFEFQALSLCIRTLSSCLLKSNANQKNTRTEKPKTLHMPNKSTVLESEKCCGSEKKCPNPEILRSWVLYVTTPISRINACF